MWSLSSTEDDRVYWCNGACGDERACDCPTGSLVAVSREPITCSPLEQFVSVSSAGAIATFSGITRDTCDGRAVLTLHYEAYTSLAVHQMQ